MKKKCYFRPKLFFTSIILIFLFSNLNSQSFDIYRLDMSTLKSERVSKIDDAGEFNPAITKNGLHIIHDVAKDEEHNIFITTIASGESKLLKGADGGNDGSFSPKGDWMAFDRVYVGDSSMYMIPAQGGERQLIRKYALDPDWSKDGKRLVFKDALNGSIRTISIADGDETIVSLTGSNPTWSPNGKYIAFSDGSNIFTVPVSKKGIPKGQPNQVTEGTDDIFYQQPEWSNNSKSIICHANLKGSFDIWLIPIFGGSQVQITNNSGGEFDPCYSQNGEFILYSKLTEKTN